MSDRLIVARHMLAVIAPTPRTPAVEWAEANRRLPTSVSNRSGEYRLDEYPYLREILNALSVHHSARRVVVMKGVQTGVSELGLSWLGYCLDLAPAPIMLVQPTEPALNLFVTQRWGSLIRDTPVLRDKAASMGRRRVESKDVVEFPGSVIKFAAAQSESDLQSMPVRYLMLDEVDRYPAAVGKSGDPVKTALGRVTTFEGREKVFMLSTPSVRGHSRIEREYLRGDQRQWHIPCPKCGAMAPLEWERVTWEPGKPETAAHRCGDCREQSTQEEYAETISQGEWVPANPSGRFPSYHLSGLLRPLGATGWRALAEMWEEAKTDANETRTFVNLQLGETVDADEIIDIQVGDWRTRREEFRYEVPGSVAVITVGVDVQAGDRELGERLEYEVVGWGAGYESWSIAAGRIFGNLESREPWNELHHVLSRTYQHERRPAGMIVGAVAIDTGYKARAVYDQLIRWNHPRWWAIKGRAGEGRPVWPLKASMVNKRTLPLFTIGVDDAKAQILQWLSLTVPGPGYFHVPMNRPDEWFEQIVSEHRKIRYTNGQPVKRWELPHGRRNEALDTRVYAYAALKGIENQGVSLDSLVDSHNHAMADSQAAPETPRKLVRREKRPVQSGWGRRR